MRVGFVHTNKVNEVVGKLAIMIPLCLMSTKFYGKRLYLYANKLPKYVHKSQIDPLDIKHIMHVPHHMDSFKYVFLYFTNFIRNDNFIYFL